MAFLPMENEKNNDKETEIRHLTQGMFLNIFFIYSHAWQRRKGLVCGQHAPSFGVWVLQY